MIKKIAKIIFGVSVGFILASAVDSVSVNAAVDNGWEEADGKWYWYENGILQGYDAGNPDYRGKEIYDPTSDAWYWLDNVQGGSKAVSKDVYQESQADDAGNIGKWVRYDADGHMIKGWDTNEQGVYYFNLTYGTMLKGNQTIDGVDYYFNETTGILESCSIGFENHWVTIDGVEYWYENGIRQGYNPMDASYRGKEIYDPESDAWYWLDNVDCGKKAVSKDVYQESDAGDWAESDDGTGKWVRYDENGHMVKGWQTNDAGTYYFDYTYGTMAKGTVTIDGVTYIFDTVSGILQGSYESGDNICNLPTDSSYYKYEYAYKMQDTSGLSESEMSFYYGLKECLDCAFELSTPYEQEKAIHDWMTDNCSYGGFPSGVYSSVAEVVFVYKAGACGNFSEAFKLCMDILGIECTEITGKSNYDSQPHAWNAVKLDGEWYLVDVTWDLNMVEQGHRDYRYKYFNLPDSLFNQDHTPYSTYDDIEATSVKYSGDYVLETTTATADAEIEALLEAHYMEDNSSTIYRIYITKEDGTDWTSYDNQHKYWDVSYTSLCNEVIDGTRSAASFSSGATGCYTFVGNDVVFEELYITTDEKIIDVEAALKNIYDTTDENTKIMLYLDKADGTDWEDKTYVSKAGKLMGVYYYNFYNFATAGMGADGKRARMILVKQENKVWEYTVEDASGEDDIDVDALNQFLADCAADNPEYDDVAIIRLNALEDADWSDFLGDILTIPDKFYSRGFVIYEDGSAAKIFRCAG
ncbi:MAG: hypothetical protein LUG83_05420 [Lachnospiraceae bacterium]|nr:hypothetical protein [Lachnospiraceae bacterium]